jgi:hypothetical protein
MNETHARMTETDDDGATQTMPASLARALVVPLAYALLFTIFFSPVIFGGRLLAPGDDTHFYAPNFFAPPVWWETLVWTGTPAFADPQAMMWYLPRLVCRLLPDGWNVFMLSAYVLAASFTHGYVLRLTRSQLSAAVSGTTFALCGFMLVHAVHATIIHAAAWTPLFVWSLEELRRGGGRRARLWFVVGALSVALSALAGHPQIFAYTICLGVALAVFNSSRTDFGRARYLALVAALVLLGAGVAALQLVPTAELAALSKRAALDFETFTTYQLPLGQLPTFIFPLVFGGAPQNFYALPYFGAWGSEGGGWNASEVTGYCGVLPLMLAALALFARRRRVLARFWCGVAIVALLLAVGSATPLAFITYQLPFINKFRVPARHFLELSFAISVLAGLGVRAVAQGEATARQIRRVVLIIFAVALAALCALALQRSDFDAQARATIGHAVSLLPWKNATVCVPLVVLLASSAALSFWSRRPAARARIVVLLVVLVCDLASLGWFSEWRKESPDAATLLTPPPVAVRLRDALAVSGQRMLAVRGSDGAREEMPPELSRLWRVPGAGGYGPLQIARTSRLLAMLPHGAVEDYSWTDPANRSLDVAAVRYITLPRADARDDNAPPSNAQSNIAQRDDTRGVEARRDDAQSDDHQRDDVRWGDDLNLSLGKSCGAPRESQRLALPAPARATHLAVVSQLACSDQIADGANVVAVTLRDDAGHTSELRLAAGRDTSEWAHDCPGVVEHVRHARAPVFSTFPTTRQPAPCVGHEYVSEVALDAPFEVTSVELRWTGGDAGTFGLKKLTLFERDLARSHTVGLASVTLGDEARWRALVSANGALVYENLRAQSRAWLVGEVLTLAPEEVLAAIKQGRLPDGRPFDPARTALVEEPQTLFTQTGGETTQQDAPSQHGAQAQASDARAQADESSVRVLVASDSKLEVLTEAKSASFLVLSDANYPGWRASVDGREAHIFQTDYALRGVFVPAGSHTVRFEFRPRSFRVGLAISLVSLALLALFVAPVNPIWKESKRRPEPRRGLASRFAGRFATLLKGDYAEKSRREKLLLSLSVLIYPFIYLCNQVFTVDGRYTGLDNDFGYSYYNYKVYLLAQLSRLHFPLWSPSEGAGFPFYASPLPASVYPLNVPLAIFYRVAGGYTEYDHQIFTILGISIFALGLFHWLRLFPLSLRAVLFATLIMSVSFKVTETMRFPNSIQTAAWQPWILFALTQIFRSATARRAISYGLLLFFFLVCHLTGGYPYFVYYTIFLVAPYMLIFMVPSLRRRLWHQPIGNIGASLAIVASAAVAALALCAPYILQMSRVMRETNNRAGGDFQYATEHEFRPLHTLGALVFPPASQPEGWYYFGLVGFLLLLLYFVGGRSASSLGHATRGRDDMAAWYEDHWIKIFFLAWFAVISYITYGRRSYLFIALFKLMPLFASLRVWGRLNIILVPVFAWLLAIAYAAFEGRVFGGAVDDTKRRATLNRQLAALSLGYAAALGAQLYLFRHKLYDFYWAQLSDFAYLRGKESQFIITGFVSFAVLAMVLVLARSRRLRSMSAPAFILVAFLCVSALDTHTVGSQSWTYTGTKTERARRDVEGEIENSFNVPRTDEEKLIPTVAPFNVGVMPNWYFRRYWQFLERAAREPDAKRKLLGVADGQRVFISRAINHETLREFLDDAASFGGASRTVSYTGDTLALDVRIPAEGYVSFIDNWDDGWEVSIDGAPAKIELLFGTFKSVRVAAGAHRVEFAYRPRFFGWLAAR